MKNLFLLLVIASSLFAAVGDTVVQPMYIVLNKDMRPTLSANLEGTMCFVKSCDSLYIMKNSSWSLIPSFSFTGGGGGMSVHGNEYHTSTFITNTYHDGLKRDTSAHDTVGHGIKLNSNDAEYIDALSKRHTNSLDHSHSNITALNSVSGSNTGDASGHGGLELSLGNPGVTGYVLSSTTGGVRSWVAAGGGAAWGGITGTLSSQTDLNTALNGKQATLTRATGAIVYTALANGTVAMAFGTNSTVKVTPTATATYTTTVPAAGCECTLIVLTSGTATYTITFGTGFKPVSTLVTGTVTAKLFTVKFVSDGTNCIETGRTTAH